MARRRTSIPPPRGGALEDGVRPNDPPPTDSSRAAWFVIGAAWHSRCNRTVRAETNPRHQGLPEDPTSDLRDAPAECDARPAPGCPPRPPPAAGIGRDRIRRADHRSVIRGGEPAKNGGNPARGR